MSWLKGGEGMLINGKSVRNTTVNVRTVYGKEIASHGKHTWKVEINPLLSGWDFAIGIATETKFCSNMFWNNNSSSNICYGYYGYHGKFSSNCNKCKKYPTHGAQHQFNTGDIITVHLDLDKQVIGFSRNNKFIGIAYENVEKKDYRLAVMLRNKIKIKLTSYSHIFNEMEEKKEKKEEENLFHQIDVNYLTICGQHMKQLINSLNYKYSKTAINKTTNVNTLCCMDENLKKLKKEMKNVYKWYQECENIMNDSQKYLRTIMKADMTNYVNWDLKTAQIWLNGLENGRYSKYTKGIINGFENDNVKADNIPQLDQGDLRSFGVKDFEDRRDLLLHFKSLKYYQEEGAAISGQGRFFVIKNI